MISPLSRRTWRTNPKCQGSAPTPGAQAKPPFSQRKDYFYF